MDATAPAPWRIPASVIADKTIRSSLRYLCVLGVSAVEKMCAPVYRRDAENAEVAQRVSKKPHVLSYIAANVRLHAASAWHLKTFLGSQGSCQREVPTGQAVASFDFEEEPRESF